jgi:hypothetical protein
MPPNRDSDPFAPPAIPTEVCCLHCGETYDSWQIEWRMLDDADGIERGFWCCPIHGCDGKGFGFDILPTDPEYQDERGGWVFFDDERDGDDEDGEDEWSELEQDVSADPSSEDTSPSFADDMIPWDDDDVIPPHKKPPGPGNDFPFSVN